MYDPYYIDYYNIIKKYENLETKDYKKILISGMGGSGINGDYIIPILNNREVYVLKDYFLPEFVDDEWLNIFISYSGDTEETISSMNDSINNKFNTIAISAGGEMERIAKEKNLYYIKIDKNFPATRYTFPIILGILLSILDKNKYYELLDILKDYKEKLRDLSLYVDDIKNPIMIYTDKKHESLALGLKMHLNEEAKWFTQYGIISEYNHHDLESISKLNIDFILLKFNYYQRIEYRINYLKDLLEQYGNNVLLFDLKYRNLLEEIVLGTLSFRTFTLKLAEKLNVDPYHSKNIAGLKAFLKNIK
ncbi:bifunctional phosphoglucose/phosphomannose isomerase [Nanobdella aerobiophila]|uniref:Bifunctional phosphoglucose/phosphomannose isomerase n=1 Tax=Nanobdella aerobiophila TaxID=2586965 RepID=A0A915WSA2_9ARCH|nr:SIS domain-containing protein [Nanobdella aerobiophila]BBL45716.1 bifunctional phosphoglucose/phosphomannose isomerase [Nanobdella aerobiophila]